MGQNHLDLVRSEEPSRTGMPTITKCQTALVHADKLVVCCILDEALIFGLCANSVEPQRVEFVCVWEDVWVRVNCNGRYLYHQTGRNNLAIG